MIHCIVLLVLSATPSPEGYDATTANTTLLDGPGAAASPIPDLRECVAASGFLPGSCFFPPWKRPWRTTGEMIAGKWVDRDLRDTVLANEKTLTERFPAGPVLAFTENEKVITAAHYPYYAAFRAACPECWNIRRLEPWELKIAQEEAGKAGISGAWAYSVTFEDLWAELPTLAGQFQEMERLGLPRAAAFLSPAMLDYVWAPDRMRLFGVRITGGRPVTEPTPAFVRATLRNNPEWICRAEKIVAKSGLGWRGWMAQHGYVPGDRTPLDVQYTFPLRWATPPYLNEAWDGPFGRVMPYDFNYGPELDWDVFREEKRRNREERIAAQRLADSYLGDCKS